MKQPVDEEEEDPIEAFMEEVSSEEAKEGLNKARKAMDMLIFHRDLNETHQDLFKDEIKN